MKIFVHIGAGKTGTSSMQLTLKENQSILNSMGIHYLGMILEHASIKRYSWQNYPAGNFNLLDNSVAFDQVLEIFNETTNELSKKGIHTLIWINESFLADRKKMIPILQFLQKEHDVEVIAYLRKHETWIRSAYVQWGIKHKVYSGKVKSFKEWYTPNRVCFYNQIKCYLDAFPKNLMLKNMEAQENLVESFLDYCKIEDKNIKIIKYNESPTDEELLLRAVYNNFIQDPALPFRFDEEFLKSKGQDGIGDWHTPRYFLESLLPSSEDIEQVHKDVSADREALNKLLSNCNEKSFVSAPVEPKNVEVDSEKLLLFLINKVIDQSFQIDDLRKKITDMIENEKIAQ